MISRLTLAIILECLRILNQKMNQKFYVYKLTDNFSIVRSHQRGYKTIYYVLSMYSRKRSVE